jgi:transposase
MKINGRSASAIEMTLKQKEFLVQLTRDHKTEQQLVKRANILLLACEGISNAEVGRRLGSSLNTIKTWRNRWMSCYETLVEIELENESTSKELNKAIANVLSDLQRSGTPKKFSLAQEQQIMSLACDKPENHGIRVTTWTQEMLAEVAKSKGLVESISRAQVGRILKNTPVTTA